MWGLLLPAISVCPLHPNSGKAEWDSAGWQSCRQTCYLLMNDCSAQSHFPLILVERREGCMPLLLICFSPSHFSFAMLQRWAVGNNLENRYYVAPVFIGTWTIYQSILWKDWLPYVWVNVSGLCWTSLYHYCLSKRMKGGMIQDTWRDEGTRAPLCLPCRFLTWPGLAVLQMSCRSRVQPGEPMGFFLSLELLPSAEANSCMDGPCVQESWAGTWAVPCLYGVSYPALPTPFQMGSVLQVSVPITLEQCILLGCRS